MLALGLIAVGCGGEEPAGIEPAAAEALIAETFPDVEVSVATVRMEGEQAVVGALFNGSMVQFWFDPSEEAEEGWELVEVDQGGNRFAVGDLEEISETMLAMNEIATALTRYRMEHDEYPSADEENPLELLVPDYLPEGTAFGDAWDQAYVYTTEEDGYTLISLGPDQASGTRDDIVLHSGEFVGSGR